MKKAAVRRTFSWRWISLAAGLLVIWLVFGSFGFLLPSAVTPEHIEAIGQWGDSFGALNALVGSLGLVGILVTLAMQRDQIREQQAEIETARKEQHRQRFESNFFQLLSLMRELRDNIAIGDGYKAGLASITGIRHSLEENFAYLKIYGDTADFRSEAMSLTAFFDIVVIPKHQNTIGPYFRIIFNMLDRLKNDQFLEPDEKHAYARLLRGQLTEDETVLLAANGMATISGSLTKLIEQFGMLKYAPQGNLLKIFKQHYRPSAFSSLRDIAVMLKSQADSTPD